MKLENKIWTNFDWPLLLLYISLVIFGCVNLYAVDHGTFFSSSLSIFSSSFGKQCLWICITIVIFVISLFLDTRFYRSLAYAFYVLTLLFALGALIWGVQVGGHRSWLQWGPIQFQPTEFTKFTCALALAKYLDQSTIRLTQRKTQLILCFIILLPVGLILLQRDIGSSLVFSAFIIVLYREGLPPMPILIGEAILVIIVLTLFINRIYLIIGALGLGLTLIGIGKRTFKEIFTVTLITLAIIGLEEGLHLVINQVLKPYQQNRIKALVDPNTDALSISWNVTQSKIAIGSGGLWGKGFLQGTQTKYGFVPEQRTDFIFSTIGEEYGWVGTFIFISVFIGLLLRILYIAERQKLRFARAYGYGVAGVLFVHFMINVGMTLGLMPVIGIPLPFISYGGSSLCAFSMMLFILLRFDAERKYYLSSAQNFS